MSVELPKDSRERARRFELEARPLLDQLYAIAYRMCGQASTAEDLVQEALLRAFQSFEQFESGTNFRAWIVRIVTNVFINNYRRRAYSEQPMDPANLPPKPAPVELSEAELQGISAEDLGKDDVLERLRDRFDEATIAALEKVPPDYRIVFLMSCLGEMTYADISKSLDIPLGTVMSRLYRARGILREELAEFARTRGLRSAEGAPHEV